MQNSKFFPTLGAAICLLLTLFMLDSCKKENAPKTPPPDSVQPDYQEIQILGRKRPNGGAFLPTCCICVTEPCPCDCLPPLNDIIFDPKDVLGVVEMNITDADNNKLSLLTIRTADTTVLKEARNHAWVGALHNYMIPKVLLKMDGQIMAWKSSKKKPGKEEISQAVEAALLETYKEAGFKGELLTFAQKVTKETLSSYKSVEIEKTSYSGLAKVFDKIDLKASTDVIKREAELQEAALDVRFKNFKSKDFYQNKLTFSVLRASNQLWSNNYINSLYVKYTGKTPTILIANGAKAAIKEDGKGALAGALGAAAAATPTGPGVGAAAATGAAIGGIAASTVEIAGQIIDWVFSW